MKDFILDTGRFLYLMFYLRVAPNEQCALALGTIVISVMFAILVAMLVMLAIVQIKKIKKEF